MAPNSLKWNEMHSMVIAMNLIQLKKKPGKVAPRFLIYFNNNFLKAVSDLHNSYNTRFLFCFVSWHNWEWAIKQHPETSNSLVFSKKTEYSLYMNIKIKN